VGMRLEDIAQIECIIAVAGGASKAAAMDAIMRSGHNHALVTDESAALELIRINESNGHYDEM